MSKLIELCVIYLVFISKSFAQINDFPTGDGLNFLTTDNHQTLDVNEAIEKATKLVEALLVTDSVPGLSVGVSVKGKEVWVDGFGFADLEHGVKVHRDSVFRVASISKSLNTILVAKLVEEGKLDWDTPISEYLKEDQLPTQKWKGQAVDITLRQLLSHTAGVANFEFEDAECQVLSNFKTVADVLKVFKGKELIFEPTTDFRYSNYGWLLITAVVEAVMKHPAGYYPLIHQCLGGKLGMTSTVPETQGLIMPNMVEHYTSLKLNMNLPAKVEMVAGKIQKAPIFDQVLATKACGAGGMLSTVPDLLKFGNVMLKSSKGSTGFLKSSTVSDLWKPLANTTNLGLDEKTSYGLGWLITEPNKGACEGCELMSINKIMWHSGGLIGTATMLVINPDAEVVVSILCNKGFVQALHGTAFKLLELFSHIRM